MLNRSLQAYFPVRTLFLGASETVLVVLAFVLAMVVRLGIANATAMLSYEGFAKILIITGIFAACLYYFDLYDGLVLNNPRQVLSRLVQVLGTVSVILAILYYASPSLELGRGISLIGMLLVGITLLAWRRLFAAVNSSPRFAARTMLFGDGPLASPLLSEFRNRPELGTRIVHTLTPQHNGKQTERRVDRHLFKELMHIVESQDIKCIIVTLDDRRGTLPVQSLIQLKTRGVRIEDGAALYEEITGKVPIGALVPSSLLFSHGFRVTKTHLVYKRIFSIAVASLGLLLTAPIVAIAIVLIRFDSAGPAILRQKRVGKDGNAFTLYKLRSMYYREDAEQSHAPATIQDKRVTRVGRWLRRTRIDEFPQLYNILRGDMHFVGPRPFVPDQERELAAKIPFYSNRWAVRPGATGWAQVNRGYCASLEDNIEKLEYDLFYIKNMSVSLDLYILLKTAKVLLLGLGGR